MKTSAMQPLRYLARDEMDHIHQTALRILEQPGMKVEHARALEYLRQAGCQVDMDKRQVKFPEAVVEAGAIPKSAVSDAAHIAVAAVNDVDYLLTWNCRHLANAQIIRRVSVICNTRGYSMPVICTPEELMGV